VVATRTNPREYDQDEGKKIASVDWSNCPLVEIIPGKVSGAALLKNTRLPVEAITGDYDAFLEAGVTLSRPFSAIVLSINYRRSLEGVSRRGCAAQAAAVLGSA
jgi:hypothetical protein